MKTKFKADIGIFSGSGMYEFAADKIESIKLNTPYGSPSDLIDICTIGGKKVAFLPRHGRKHSIPPHKINYRANLWAMKELGVSRIISPCACGSLQKIIKPGDFVVTDQFIDRTKGREDTFSEGPEVMHISSAEPYCPELRKLAVEAIESEGGVAHEQGTIVVINGPRFSSKAESEWFMKMGWDTVNMTQYPEVVLAQELGICIVNIAMITDYDAGLAGDVPEVNTKEVIKMFQNSVGLLQKILLNLVKNIPDKRKGCRCLQKVDEAYFC
ncbi:MAG: 5-methylthioadenosine phosphorylase [Clostridiales bacterium]|jgi:5'-methylthioadenosine phosphorylase|nr:5-methylthioadenosine phosphorylase [Clostridiales bacterium]MDN5281449.1 5-methylthioadenosine phosphorylase [Candidatus Ozemobacter sp.]